MESMTTHIPRQYDTELETIRSQVMEMGGLVKKQIRDGLGALINGDIALAEEVINNDYRINKLDVAIEEACSQVITRQQPLERDLRLVMTVIKIVSDLERSGDEAEKVARMAIRLANQVCPADGYLELYSLGDHVGKMLHDALDAFARLDMEAALRCAAQDRQVDKGYKGIVRQKITFMLGDPRTISRSLDLISAARSLERIGDYAFSINEHVIYLVQIKEAPHEFRERAEQP